jgi:RNA polymerase I-specific transcription initiation factor RRN5
MSSDSDEYIDHAHSPHRQSTSTPETPRKRRRASTISSRQRRHKQPRRHDVESHYSDEYRGLFNEHVKNAASRFEVHETARDSTSQIGLSLWTPKEKAVFFAALERLGRDNLPGIARATGTKSAPEIRDFLLTLQDAAVERGDTKLTLRDIPAAIDLAPACNQQLERAADALAWYQERHEASLEQERYGEYWLITPHIADDIDDAINGVVRPRSASTPYDEPKRAGSGIAGSCIPCKTRKVKCDRGRPCGRCVRTQRECEYPGGTIDAVKADETHVDARPRSASGLADNEHDEAGGGFVG